MTTKEKILQFIDYKGISKRDFYKKTGLSNGFLNSGKYIGSDNLEIIISNYPELSLEWLIMNSGEMIKTKSVEKINNINVNKKVNEIVNNPNVQKKLTFENETAITGMVAEGRSGYGKPQTDAAHMQELQERLHEQKELYTGQIQFLTAQIDVLTKDKDERISELKEHIQTYRERIEELKEQISVLKNVSPLDDTQRGVG